LSVHEERRDDIAAYAIGGLDEASVDELREHLDGCRDCRDYLSWLQPAVDVLPASVEQVSPPPELRERLMGTVRDEVRSAQSKARRRTDNRWRSWRGIMLRPATGFAAAGAVVIGVVAGYALHDSDNTDPALSATVVRNGGEAQLAVDNMPQPDEGDVYKVWVERGGAMQPSKSFVPASDGSYETAIPGPLGNATQVAITEETQPSVTKPSLPAVVSATL
jgi:anti-sigma-K factor RskA